jgi:intracellular sulfur oxidation DsrE/DsrF family protein
MTKQIKGRRAMIAGLGAVATAGALGGRGARAQGTSTSAPFEPALHTEDAWMSGMRGTHRMVLDVTTPEGVPDGIRFAGNLFNGHKTGYGVDEAEVAIIMCLRHGATAYGYGDAIWGKYGKTIDAKATPSPTANPFNSGARMQFSDLATRGVQFIVCGTASRGLAGRIAGPGGDADAVLKEMAANLNPNARIVAAGVVGVIHAQERGFRLLYVG